MNNDVNEGKPGVDANDKRCGKVAVDVFREPDSFVIFDLDKYKRFRPKASRRTEPSNPAVEPEGAALQ